MHWLRNFFTSSPAPQRELPLSAIESAVEEANKYRESILAAGSVNGVHYTGTVETIKQLKREGRHSEAIQLLLQSVEATESESRFAGDGWGVAPWYYEQLAIIYRKEKRYEDEISILERYMAQPKALGVGPAKLKERLVAAKKLLKARRA
ncbi:tetratricopeptide repeat protein [Geothrix alkalitolerans]|uniref:tetratricopeptide repeat protein n=1 Tax=Geothrix alkalitolerans TaxID=2922724 RepID=UPI001FAEC69A|nr:tetratricopeptide repeat protein [Geothrix alkalitolerans]